MCEETDDVYDEESVCQAIGEANGDATLAVILLQRKSFQSYMDRIWTEDGFSSDDDNNRDDAFRLLKIPIKVKELVEDQDEDAEVGPRPRIFFD